MAAAATARLIRGPPPSPPHSTDGDPAAESHPESYGIYHHPSLYSGRSASLIAEKKKKILFAIFLTNRFLLQYAPTSDYSHSVPLQNSMMPKGLQVNTPPASDDSLVSGSLDSSARWSSPSSQKQISSKARVARSPRVRRRAKKTKDRGSRPNLPGPLSEITKHMTHIPIRDMESWVHRSISVRHQEVAKKNGKVARPMNSFMLYRSAYADRTKEWFAQNNHQVVSEAAGDSWKQEPREVREKYELLANIEKNNHLQAHPGYKFTPAKDKKKRPYPDDNRSFLGDKNTPESSPALLHATFSSSEIDSNGWESSHSTPFDMLDHGLPTENYLASSWPTSNPGGPLSSMMLASEPSQYMYPSSSQGLMGYSVEDPPQLKKVELEEIQYTSSTALAGLPGAAHHDLLRPQPQIPISESCPGGQLDPQLLEYTGGSSNPASQVYASSHYSMWQESPTSNCYLPVTTSIAPSSISYNGASPFHPGMQPWESSQEASLDASGGEFDNWIN
ncbi:hypothetical protein P175DRAFT_0485766 [Aspergillus ochraceoroseus IBT 24754]|uniref:HMG box domain-containing protein n=1 Tax=Aspergillus ochraceoroseus IBT 24754 TaxID=1392256 RepID=A0A2T5LPY8_9EURO|nr:uncharacterized protein P175DRAFT_0485766 [Aspergillus ochraceoroseus IBT 24754]PTU18339.1 hypothetical protein P175DRAFT_0485766 [Aspergillus ochraceoroseus IBT 24754]